MKICFPVTENNGMQSRIHEHFGSAPMFLLVDVTTGEVTQQTNNDRRHGHGSCQPFKALAGQTVDGIVVGGIGKSALTGLQQAGIKVFQAQTGSIADNLSKFTAGNLQEISLSDTCGGHTGTHRHDCGHRHGLGEISHEGGCGF